MKTNDDPASQTARERFASSMRERRIELKMSQEDLAEKSGLHRNYVGSVERAERNVSIDNMEAIAKALRCPIVELLRGA